MTLLAAVLALSLTPLTAATPTSEPPEARARVVEDTFVVRVPPGFADDHSDLGDNGVMMTISDGDAALVLTFYRPKAVSGPRTALKRHAQTLRKKVGATAPTRQRTHFFGKSRAGQRLSFHREGVHYSARVVSASAAGYVVVATWSWPTTGTGPSLGGVLEAVVAGVARQ
ncbi:MAG: hypothetical protein ACI9MR_000848 [Myxococcota bacterium]|jgi:hypothetical protein